jgi:DNA-binding CsgD family transcriptional regulator
MIGNTLVADGELVANITLMRPRGMPTFDAAEVRRFERLSEHMRRALQTGFALEARRAGADRWAALAALPGAVAVVDVGCRLAFANAPMEALLRAGDTLARRGGRLVAVDPAAQARLAASVRGAADAPSAPVWLPTPRGVLLLDATPLAPQRGGYLPAERLVLLAARRGALTADEMFRLLRERYGCTRSEAALAVQLGQGQALNAAAAAQGLTYGSARVYLKTLFQKLGVHSQAQLVAKLARLGET